MGAVNLDLLADVEGCRACELKQDQQLTYARVWGKKLMLASRAQTMIPVALSRLIFCSALTVTRKRRMHETEGLSRIIERPPPQMTLDLAYN